MSCPSRSGRSSLVIPLLLSAAVTVNQVNPTGSHDYTRHLIPPGTQKVEDLDESTKGVLDKINKKQVNKQKGGL